MDINWTIDEVQFLLKDFCEFCRKNYKKAIGVGQMIISDYIATLLEGSYGV